MELPFYLYHLVNVGNRNVMFDGATYAVIEIDKKFATRLAELKSNKRFGFGDGADSIDREILHLVSDRILSGHDKKQIVKPALRKILLMLTSGCNLRCKYCFENGVYSKRLDMPHQIAEESLRYLMRYSPHDSVKTCFFGGEPLLRLELLKYIIKFGCTLATKHKKKISFSIVTNGTRITGDVADFFAKNLIDVQISVDGNKEGHDANRVFSDSTGSFDLICNNIEVLKRRSVNYSLLTVVNKHVLETAIPWISKVDSLSGGNFDFVFVSDKRKIIKLNATELKKALSLYAQYLQKNQNIPAVIKILTNMKKGYKCYYGCNAGLEELVVMPNGDINFCERLTGKTQHNIFDDVPPDKLWQNYSKSVEDNVCNRCWAKYLCGGGCAHTSLLFTKNKQPVWWECKKKKLEIETAIKTLYVNGAN